MDKAEHLEAIMAAARRIHETIDMIDVIVSARLGIHRNDLRCLHILELAPATPGEIALKTGLTSGSVTALLVRLEGAGFIERQRSLADRRSVEIALPEYRLAEIQTIHGEIKQAIRDFFSERPVADVADSGKALAAFADALGLYTDRARADAKCPNAGLPMK